MSPQASPMEETGVIPPFRTAVITGGAAGALTVTGIKVGDVTLRVINLTDGADVSAEFSITAANTISNAGGTATTSDKLLVMWFANPNA